MMGRLKSDQGQLFYEFCLGDAVPEDHLVRKIDAALDPRMISPKPKPKNRFATLCRLATGFL